METNEVLRKVDVGIDNNGKKYWENKLNGDFSRCTFPFTFSNSNSLNNIDEYSFIITDNSYYELIRITKSNNYAIHAFLIGLINTLIYKYTKETEIIIGTPVYKQQPSDINPEGFLIIKNLLSDNLTFKEILINTKEDIQNSISNKELTLNLIDNLIDIPNRKNKLFNISVSLTNIQDTEYMDKIHHDFKFIFTKEDKYIKCILRHAPFQYFNNFIQNVIANLLTLLESVLNNINTPLASLNVLSQEEKEEIVNDFNQTQILNNTKKTILDIFYDQVKKNPDKTAVCFPVDMSDIFGIYQTGKDNQFEKNEDSIVIEKLTYKQLNEKANQIAHFLKKQGVSGNQIIGLLFDPSIEMLVGIIGVLKCGAAFLPINTELPEERIKLIIKDSNLRIIFSLGKYNKLLNRLLWQCDNFKAYVCIDTDDIENEEEVEKSDYMYKELWDRTGDIATNDITGGGWLSSFTGEAFSEQEMEEYGENIVKKLKPLITNQSRILEIGCSSGISLFKLAPFAKYYRGIDLSDTIINYTKKRVEEEGLKNVKLSCLPAHEIDKLNEDQFDVIILNSVIQSFHGHNYLRKVLGKAVKKLNDKGIIFVGDIMDYDSKDEMIKDLKKFKEDNPDRNYKTKTDFSIELFANKAYFEDLLFAIPEIKNVKFSNKIYTIENELTKYRFDAILQIDKLNTIRHETTKPHKFQYDLNEIAKYKTDNVPVNTLPSDIAYVIYTSGTSGNPKGVMIKNENLINYNYWFQKKAALNYNDKTVLTSSYAFDLGYTSIFTSILGGCELHIVEKNFYLSPERLIDYINSNQITYLKVTPSFLSILVNNSSIPLNHCKSLRLILVGGENINIKDIEKIKVQSPGIQIINHYGPTETTIGCITHQINNFGKYKIHTVIGGPINNTNAYILDDDLNILPIGVPGELFIGGNGVGKGYLNNPVLTDEKFFLNPHNKDEIFYRTGDLAKWLPDGTIQFLGRADNQVKVKGYRIELNEIENKLLKHPVVKDSIVICKKNKNGDNYLCAYIVSQNENSTNSKNSEFEIKQNVEYVNSDTTYNFWEKFKEQIKKYEKNSLLTTTNEKITYCELDFVSDKLALKIKSEYDDSHKLSKNERIRYKRQMLLDGWGLASQEKLKATKVFVAGAGGGASPTIMQLALAGVGKIVVCDFDTVELSNLNRQFLHNESRIGINKAESAKQTINEINPNVEVIPITEKLTQENIEDFIGDSDIIFDMFDEQIDKFLISQYAVKKGIPHIISAMIDINSYTAILHSPFTPCFHCLFDKNKLTSLTGGMKNFIKDYKKNPLAVVASSLFVSTGFAVNEALKICLGIKQPAYNKFFYFSQRPASTFVDKSSYESMTYTLSDHFKKTCKNQGYDWEIGWRGNYLEEFIITKDPNCPVCSNFSIEPTMDIPSKSRKVYSIRPTKDVNNKEKKTVAILLENPIKQSISFIAINKLGFSCLKLDNEQDVKILGCLLDDNDARIIITDSDNQNLACKLKDQVNKNIKLLIIDEFDSNTDLKSDINYSNDSIAFIDYDIEKEKKITYNFVTHQQLTHLINNDRHKTHNSSNADQYNNYKDIINIYQTILISNGEAYSFTNNHDINTFDNLRNYLLKELPDYMIPSFFIPIEKVPITSNGKLNYKELPEPGDISKSKLIDKPKNSQEKILADIWSEVLGIKEIGVNENFLSIGGDSIKIIQILSKLNQKGYKLNIQDFFNTPTIAELATKVKLKENEVIQQNISGEAKLTPIQRWFFSNNYSYKNYYNQAIMLSSNKRFSIDAIRKIFIKIQQHHDMLKATYVGENQVKQVISEDYKRLALEIVDIKDDTNEDDILKRKVNEIQGSINLESGPLMKLALFNMSEGDRLLIVIHHLVVDGISWRIILEDLSTLFIQYEEGKDLKLPLKTDSYQEWANKLYNYALSNELLEEMPYWQNIKNKNFFPIPSDNVSNEGKIKDIKNMHFSLPKDQTRALLKRKNLEINAEAIDILLASLSLSIKNIFNLENALIALEGHGRENFIEGIDITRTVGWFTTLYPQILTSIPTLDLKEYLLDIKRQINETPKKGFGYGILKYVTPDDRIDKSVLDINPNISFNYLGQFDTDISQLQYKIDNKNVGNTINIEGKQDFDISVSGIVYNEQLQITFQYNSNRFEEFTVQRFLNDYMKNIISFLNIFNNEIVLNEYHTDFYLEKIKTHTSKIDEEIQDVYRLTQNQKAFLHQSIKNNAQRVQCIYSLTGYINPELFNQTINEVANRYDVLRTIFYFDDITDPQQIVLKNKQYNTYYLDISNHIDKDRIEIFNRFQQDDWEKGFDLNKEVMRISLFKIEENNYKMIWSINRIIADGWCIGLLFNDFINIYKSKCFATPLHLKQVRPYKDYVKFINNMDKKDMTNYWASYLKNISKKTYFSQSRKAKDEIGFELGEYNIALREEVSNCIKEISVKNKITLNNTMVTIIGSVIAKIINRNDIIIGQTVSGRDINLEDVNNMVGLFINTVPVRISLKSDSTFITMATDVQKKANESIIYQNFPIDEIEKLCNIEEGLTDINIMFQNYYFSNESITGANTQTNGLKFKREKFYEQTNYNMNIFIFPNNQIQLLLSYNANVYTDETIDLFDKEIKKFVDNIITETINL